MRTYYPTLLITALSLIGCDRISGEAEQRILDAESIGYACRVSRKTPEDCIKENETQSPTYLLTGWKAADKDISEKLLDPNMGAPVAPVVPASAPASAAPNSAPAVKAESKAVTEKPAAAKSGAPANNKSQAKTGAAPGKAEAKPAP